MVKQMLNPVWLETFITLVDTGHFTQTAEKLFMTQPGVSQHINKLEEACGHLLIKRDKKSFVVTEQGRLVYNYTKQLKQGENNLFEQLNFDNPFAGQCSLACSGALALMLYPKLLRLQAQQPDLHVSLKAAPNHQILQDVKTGQIDQGIVTNIPNESFFDYEALGQEELCLILGQQSDDKLSLTQTLLKLGLIAHPDAEHYLSLYVSRSEERELKRLEIGKIPVIGSINQIGQILEPLALGMGFTVLPKSAVNSFHSPELLTIIKPKKPVMESLYLVRKKNRILPKRYNALNTIIKNVWA